MPICAMSGAQPRRLLPAASSRSPGFAIYLHLTHSALPFWHNERGFGPFPNRNQTGDLFGISTVVVLGCMQDDFRRGHKRWILWLLGAGVLIAALILAFSRAGILILVPRRHRVARAAGASQMVGGGIAVAILRLSSCSSPRC